MSRRTQIILAGVAAGALTATGVTAYAQSKQDPAPRRVEREVRVERIGGDDVRVERDGKTVIIRHGDRAGMQKDHAEHLKAILQLRPNQEAALTAYLEAMKPKERTIRVDADDDKDGKTTTPERLARMEQQLNERQAEQRARIEATRRFYGQLDAAQKRAFDELPPMMGGGEVRVFRTMHRGGPMMDFHGHGFDHDMPMPPRPPKPPGPPAPPSL